MVRYNETDINKIRDATDALALVREYAPDLRMKGREYWACCPFHKEKSPSFKVDPNSGRWHCFGACGEGGDVFSFVMKTQNLSFPEAVKLLADRAGIEIAIDPQAQKEAGRRKRLLAVCSDTVDFYATYLRRSPAADAAAARDYLSRRGFGSDIATQWKLGYAVGKGELVRHLRTKGHRDEDMVAANVAMHSHYGKGLQDRFFKRLIFPISDAQGQAIAFGGRVLDNSEPKYINSSETPLFNKSRNLYGLDHAKRSMHTEKTVLVVEGYTDVIALSKAGFEYCVATLGTALTAQHVKILSRTVNRVVYIFDGDEAGMRAADKASEHIDRSLSPEYSASPVNLDVVCLPQGADPADLMESETGKAQFTQLLLEAKPLIEFALDRRLGRWDLSRPEERVKALNDSVIVLAPLKGSMLAGGYANYVADSLTRAGGDVTEAQVLEALEDARPSRPSSDQYGIAEAEQGLRFADTFSAGGNDAAGASGLSQLTPTELMERELLALMIVAPAARDYILQNQNLSPFTHPMYRAAYDKIAEFAHKEADYSVKLLDEDIPGMAQLVTAYDFEGSGESVRDLADSLLYRLRESALERKIRIIRSDLQRDNENSKVYLEALTAASQELHQIREKRFQ
ncbi:MAG: DNA primase [Coriobacteriia bacterium]|nr:DNA primase [Coriobacteriia bacterium]